MSSALANLPALNGLRTEEFLERVYATQPATAVFDYDGTLWPGDAGSGFMRWTMTTGLLTAEKTEWLHARHASYHRGEVDEITICGEMVQVYEGLPESVVRQSAREYFRQLVQPHLYPVMVELIRELKRKGVEIWAVSSTNNWLIEECVRELGITPDRVLAACVASSDGHVTATLVDVPSDEGKAVALHRVGLARPDLVFGNSIHDAAMLELARQPFAVNPNPRLQNLATERGWPVYFPVSLTYRGEQAAAADAGSV